MILMTQTLNYYDYCSVWWCASPSSVCQLHPLSTSSAISTQHMLNHLNLISLGSISPTAESCPLPVICDISNLVRSGFKPHIIAGLTAISLTLRVTRHPCNVDSTFSFFTSFLTFFFSQSSAQRSAPGTYIYHRLWPILSSKLPLIHTQIHQILPLLAFIPLPVQCRPSPPQTSTAYGVTWDDNGQWRLPNELICQPVHPFNTRTRLYSNCISRYLLYFYILWN